MSKMYLIQCDKIMETKLKENSKKLGISISDLIDRYIRQELCVDNDYLKKPKLSWEQLREISKRDAKRDRKNGIFPKPHSDSLVGICNRQK